MGRSGNLYPKGYQIKCYSERSGKYFDKNRAKSEIRSDNSWSRWKGSGNE